MRLELQYECNSLDLVGCVADSAEICCFLAIIRPHLTAVAIVHSVSPFYSYHWHLPARHQFSQYFLCGANTSTPSVHYFYEPLMSVMNFAAQLGGELRNFLNARNS